MPKPQVLLLLEPVDEYDDLFDHMYTGLCIKIEEHYTVVKTTSLTEQHLIQSEAVIITHGNLTKKKRKNIQIRLSAYARAGGTVIFACQFSNTFSGPNFDIMCRNMGLSWGWGDYYRTEFALNPAFASVLGEEAFRTLEQSYGMKAVHLTDVSATSKV